MICGSKCIIPTDYIAPPMIQEAFLEKLLQECYEHSEVDLYDLAYQVLTPDQIQTLPFRQWTHQAVKEKLLNYVDEEKTRLHLTNYGRYWVSQGGYLVFLRDGQLLRQNNHREKDQHKEELLEARLKLTHYRLWGFWLTLVVSMLGFLLSLLNLYLFFLSRR